MSYYLRAINDMILWDPAAHPFLKKKGELPCCITRDLHADDNALSLWEVPDDKSNIQYILAAIASQAKANLQKKNRDYALIDKEVLESLFFTPNNKPANTAFVDYNKYHFDIAELTLDQVVQFAHILSEHGDFNTVIWKDIKIAFTDANKNNKLKLDLLTKPIKDQFHIK
jgi:hypothetical protein